MIINSDELHETLKKLRYCQIEFRVSTDDEWKSGRLMSLHINRLVGDRGIVASVMDDDDSEKYTVPLHKGSDVIKFNGVESGHVKSKVEEYENKDLDELHDSFARWEHRPDIEDNDDSDRQYQKRRDHVVRETDFEPDFDDDDEDDEHNDEDSSDEKKDDTTINDRDGGEMDLPKFVTDYPLFIVKLKNEKWLDLNALGQPLRNEPASTRSSGIIDEYDAADSPRKVADNVWIVHPDSDEPFPFDVNELKDNFT